ncbi:hypothetical protein DVQ07_18670, partial [Yersinia enterocolitica]|nr:hypothetical protein [Yersinia enterocolitica]
TLQDRVVGVCPQSEAPSGAFSLPLIRVSAPCGFKDEGLAKKKTLADKGKRLKFSGLQTTMSVPHSTLCPVCDEDIQHRLHGQ